MAEHRGELSTATYLVSPYRPDGGYELSGVLQIFLVLFVLAGALGWAADFVSQWLYLVLIFPLAIGAILGAVGAKLVRHTKLRNGAIAAALGLIVGIFAMLVMHYAGYQRLVTLMTDIEPDAKNFIQATREEKARVRAETSPENLPFLKDLEAMSVASKSLPSYMEDLAQQGVSISRHSDKGINLGYYGSYIYWLSEVLLVAGLAFYLLRKLCSLPPLEKTGSDWLFWVRKKNSYFSAQYWTYRWPPGVPARTSVPHWVANDVVGLWNLPGGDAGRFAFAVGFGESEKPD